MVYPALGAAFGCWSGAIPLGLDWERPWQVSCAQNPSMLLLFTASAGMAIDSGVWRHLGIHHWFAGCVRHEHGALAGRGRHPVAPIYCSKAAQEPPSIAVPMSQCQRSDSYIGASKYPMNVGPTS